jgi:hypothetical protein
VSVTPLDRWHVGPWIARGTVSGGPLQPGRRRTPDELNLDVIGLARILGRRLSIDEELRLRMWQSELWPTFPRLCGVHTLADGDQLAATAREAFAWLRERAPRGYRFVLTDAVYLEPETDLEADTVAVDRVVEVASERGTSLPSARLAVSHVRRGRDGWVAGDAACRWAGPFRSEDEAVAAVEDARAMLVDELRRAGHDDLAGTAPRWLPVPVGRQVATK